MVAETPNIAGTNMQWWSVSGSDGGLFSELSRASNCQYGQEPLALVRPGVQFSQNTRFRTLLALSGSTLPHWRGDQGGLARPQANGCSSEATERALWLRRWFWRDPPTQCPLLFIYTQQKQKSLLQSAVTQTHTHTHPERLFVLIIHKQSLNLNSLLTSATLASVWSDNEFPITQFYSRSSCHSFGF